MCKIGIVSIGVDLYLSAFQHFKTVLILVQYQQPFRNVAIDLAAHLVALMTLVQTFRGRVNRQACGRITCPVLTVRTILELEILQQQIRQQEEGASLAIGLKDILVVAKSALFLFITAKLAFGSDKSYVGADEWFPNNQEELYDISEEEQKESDQTKTNSSHRDKKTK